MTMRDCEGKRVLIIGGATGLGLGAAERLVAAGARVFLSGRRAERLEEAAHALPSTGCAGTAPGDATDEADVDRIVARAAAAMDGLDALVVSAGTTSIGSVLETDRGEMIRVLGVNVLPLHLVSKAAVPHMPETGGAIVAIASVAATVAHARRLAYCASKAAVLGMVRQMALDLAGRRVRVNAVSPSLVLTEMSLGALSTEPDPDAALERRLGRHPLGRLGTPEEVGEAVTYLISEKASWITGQNLVIDGGLSL